MPARQCLEPVDTVCSAPVSWHVSARADAMPTPESATAQTEGGNCAVRGDDERVVDTRRQAQDDFAIKRHDALWRGVRRDTVDVPEAAVHCTEVACVGRRRAPAEDSILLPRKDAPGVSDDKVSQAPSSTSRTSAGGKTVERGDAMRSEGATESLQK